MNETKLTTKEIGNLGEKIAAEYLVKHGFSVVEINYWRKWGEIDIVAKKENSIHFIEVKAVSYETKEKLEDSVTHETWRPEEQVHSFKLHQIEKSLKTWISDNNYVGDWVIDVLAVRLVPRETFASVNFIENITQ